MASNISLENALSSYALFNATDTKRFIIDQLSSGDSPTIKDSGYLGSNMNHIIDALGVILQQILFNYNVNASEASFNSAALFESMVKIVSILNYKPYGKQTSMLPVRFSINLPESTDFNQKTQFTIPRFTTIHHNSSYVLKNEIVTPISQNSREIWIDSIMFQGDVQESPIYTAYGDEFEVFTLNDPYINKTEKFISDNFFVVYVDENADGNWEEYTEINSIFEANGDQKVYEKKFTEGFDYEFKFGNGINGFRLPGGARVVIFYILSSGEDTKISSDIISIQEPNIYSSALYTEIYQSVHEANENDITNLSYITVSNTGPSTDISYQESVNSIRKNAPRVFSSQNRLFSLADYKTFVDKNFAQYIKDTYFMTNDEYVSSFLKYYYDLGYDAPQEDNRVNIAQVEFMTANNFNNVYCVLLPSVNTIISGKIPNYLNTSIKHEITSSAKPYQGISHNIVIIDPIYKACTFGSLNLDDTDFNEEQLQNKLVLQRNVLTKYSVSFIKDSCATLIRNIFNNIKLGDKLNTSEIAESISAIPGVRDFYIKDIYGNTETRMTFYVWNPLYSNNDNIITQQNVINEKFAFVYFYDLDNIENLIEVE